MGEIFESTAIRSRRRTRRPRSSDPRSLLAELGDRFANFRQGHPRGARVPSELRSAALAALRSGVPPGDLYRACGISWGQVAAWKKSEATSKSIEPRVRARSIPSATRGDHDGESARRNAGSASRADRDPRDVRVFSVVDDDLDRPSAAKSSSNDLELRLGSWTICVRLEDPRARRG